MRADARTVRNQEIIGLVATGLTYDQVGVRFGLTRQRIEQILSPAKSRARSLLAAAVERSDITRPAACARCEKARRLSAHHHDYSLPLEVEWLCSECHGLAHSIQGPQLPPPVPDDADASKDTAAVALAAKRMTKMTPEQRSEVARLGGYAKARAIKLKKALAAAEEPKAVSA